MTSQFSRVPGRNVWRRLLLLAVLPGLLLTGPSCTRQFFRKRADKEVTELLSQKEDPAWHLDGFHVLPHPYARFADDTNPDRPPMPPDDPAAKAMSPNPQHPPHSGITLVEGVGYLEMLDNWDQQNRAELAAAGVTLEDRQISISKLASGSETPSAEDIRAFAERQARRELADIVTTQGSVSEEEAERSISKQRTYLIKLDQAVELGLVNSREYQTRRELLYLSALPVTLERFAFTPQFFAAGEAIREKLGREVVPDGPVQRWRLNSTAGMSQLFSTGALLLLSFANRTVFNLGNKPDFSNTTVALDLIQPLLQGGGRTVVMEPLTQAERNLLYSVRDFARFRQEFYVFVAAGQPTFIPGVEAGVQALTGGTITAPGVFIPGAVSLNQPNPINGTILSSTQVPPGQGTRLFPTGLGNAPPQGYLSTLVQKAALINQYRNIVAFRRYLDLFRVYLEGNIVNAVQVGQVEQTLLRAVRDALTQQASYRSNVDQFKQQLGLPPCVNIEVADEPLQPLFDQTRRFEDISSQFEQVSATALNLSGPEEVATLRDKFRRSLTDSRFVRGTQFSKNIGKRLDEWENLPPGKESGKDDNNELESKLDSIEKERRELVRKREVLKEQSKGDLSKKEQARLEELDFERDLGRFERAHRVYARRLWEQQKDPARQVALRNLQFTVVYRQLLALLEVPFRERLEDARKRWPDLPPLCIDGVDLLLEDDDTVLAAITRSTLANRLDLMNRRAQLVDSWRKIAVAANGLLGTFNVAYHYDTFSPVDAFRPFSLGGSRYRSQLVISGELPLVRIQERNNYRAALIAYQQQRRALQLAEDQVLFAVRLELRQLRAAANNYHKVQKRAVELAYQQVDQALQAFSQPQAPPGPAAPPGSVGAPAASSGGGDPAALTQQLLQAQSALLSAQNDLYNTWINFITTRMSIYRDMGVMQVDKQGVWMDQGTELCSPNCGDGCGKPEGNQSSEKTERPAAREGKEQRPETLPRGPMGEWRSGK